MHLFNNYDDYYFDATSGIQFTNHYQDYWSRNVYCAGFKTVTNWVYYCDDAFNFSWSIDNTSEEVNVTGYKDINLGLHNVRVGLQYHLAVNDTNLTVSAWVRNIGVLPILTDIGFAWRITNISIGNNSYEDYLYLNNTISSLNDSFHYWFHNDTSDGLIVYGDFNTSEKLWLSWNKDLNYYVNATPSYTDVAIVTNGLNPRQLKGVNFEWLDAKCGVSCFADKDADSVVQGGTFWYGVMGSFTAGCLLPYSVGVKSNYSGTYEYISTTGNLSVSFSNPRTASSGTWYNFTITGNDPGNYSLASYCQSGDPIGRAVSGGTIKVNATPTGNCISWTDIDHSTTLSSDSTSCYNITNSNVVFDCADHSIMANDPSFEPVFLANDIENLSILNCLVYDSVQGVWMRNVTNWWIENFTVENSTTTESEDLVGRAILSNVSSNGLAKNIVYRNGNASNKISSCHEGGVFLLQSLGSLNISISDVLKINMTGEYYDDLSPDIPGCQAFLLSSDQIIYAEYGEGLTASNVYSCDGEGYSLEFYYFNDSVLDNFSLIDNKDTNPLYIFNSDNITLNKSLLNGSYAEAYIFYSTNLSFENIEFNTNESYSGVVLSAGSNNSFKNILITGGEGGFSALSSSYVFVDNITLQNLTKSQYGFLDMRSRNSVFNNVVIQDSNISDDYGGAVFYYSAQEGLVTENFTIRNIIGSAIGLYLTSTYDYNIKNFTITNITKYDINNILSANVNVTDSSFNKSNVRFFTASDDYTMGFYRSIRVNTTNDGVVNFTDVNGTLWYSEATSGGLTDYVTVLEYVQNASDNYTEGCSLNQTSFWCYNPYNLSASNSYGFNETYYNVSSSYDTIPLYLELLTDTCTPPASGNWVMRDLCIYTLQTVAYTDGGFIMDDNSGLYLNQSNMSIKNLTVNASTKTYINITQGYLNQTG